VLERDIAYRFWKVNRNQDNWDQYKLMRNWATNTIKYSNRQFMMSHLDINQAPKRLWRRIRNGTNGTILVSKRFHLLLVMLLFTSPGPNAGSVAFSVQFHDFTPFPFRSMSAQEVQSRRQSGWILCPFDPPHCKFFQFLLYSRHISSGLDVIGDCVARLNDDLARIHRWSISNGLLLNPNKTKSMFICRSRAAATPPPVVVAGVTIPYLSKNSDFGMTLNNRLMFDGHINDLCSRVHYTL
jgi:hypothetical protein